MATQRDGSAALSQWVAVGALAAGLVGGVVGLVVGLLAHPATAWFAVFELGVPAGVLGALLGFVLGALTKVTNRIRRKPIADD